MSETVDNRVVQLRFEGRQFEQNAEKSINTLERLKKALQFGKDSSTSTFDELAAAADRVNKNFSLSNVEEGLKQIPIVGNAAIGAIRKFGEEVYQAGKNIVNGLVFDPPMQGFKKYEQKAEALQTIMLSTGKSLEEVNVVLERLNWYTDQTSYNFTDMAGTIGKFTSAGIKLDDAEVAMEGIANWAASAGVNARTATRAFYNMAQAMSIGAVKAQDWKSIEMLNMSTKAFQETAIDTAIEMGRLTKASEHVGKTADGTTISVKGFRDTLKDGWLDNEVFVETMRKYADTTTDFGMKMFKAAQEYRTFTDAIEAAKEVAQTGWSKTFELIFGNYLEAKNLWAALGDTMIDALDASAKARNGLIEDWKKLGGRTILINAIVRAFGWLRSILQSVRGAFETVFPPITAERLVQLTKKFNDFMLAIKPADELLTNIYLAFQGLFSIVKLVGTVFASLFKTLFPIAKPLGIVVNSLTDLIGVTGAIITALTEMALKSEKVMTVLRVLAGAFLAFKLLPVFMSLAIGKFLIFNSIIAAVVMGIIYLKNHFNEVIDSIRNFIGQIAPLEKLRGIFQQISGFAGMLRGAFTEGINRASTRITALVGGLTSAYEQFKNFITNSNTFKTVFGTGVSAAVSNVQERFKAISDTITDAVNGIKEFIKTADFSKIASGLRDRFTIGLRAVSDYLTKIVGKFEELDIYSIVVDKISKAFNYVASRASSLVQYVRDFVNNIKELTSSTNISSAISAVFDGIKASVTGFVSTILQSVENLKSFIGSFKITDFFDSLRDSATNFSNNIKDLPSTARSALSKVIDAFREADLSKITLPSFDKLKTGIESLKTNITDATGRFREFVSSLSIGSRIQSVFSGILVAVAAIPVAIGAAVTGVWKLINSINPLEAIASIWNGFISFIQSIPSLIEKATSSIRNFLETSGASQFVLGIWDGIAGALTTIGTVASTVFSGIAVDIRNFAGWLKSLKKSDILGYIEKISDKLSGFVGVVKGVAATVAGVVTSMVDRFKSFINFDSIVSNLTTNLGGLKTAIVNAFSNIGETGIVNAILNPIKNAIDGIGSLREKIFDLITGRTATSVTRSGGGQTGIFAPLLGNLSDLKNALAPFVTTILGKLKDLNIAKIAVLGLAIAFTKLGFSASSAASSLAGTLKNVKGVSKDVSDVSSLITKDLKKKLEGGIKDWLGLKNSVDKVTNSITDYYKNMGKLAANPPTKITDIAVSIGILAASLWAISSIPEDDLIRAGIAMGGLAVGLGVLAVVVGKFGNQNGWSGLASAALMMVGFAGSAYILLQAFDQIRSYKWADTWEALTMLGVIMAGLMGVMIGLSTWAPTMAKGAISILAMAFAIKKVTEALVGVLTSDIKLEMNESISVLLGAVMALSVLAFAASRVGVGTAAGLLAIVGVIFLMEAVLKKIQGADISFEQVKANIEKFVITFIAIGALLAVIGIFSSGDLGKHAIATALGLLVVVWTLGKLVDNLERLKNVDASLKTVAEMKQLLIGLAIVLAAIGLGGKHAIRAAVGLLVINHVVLSLIGTIKQINDFSDREVKKALQTFTWIGVLLGALIGLTALTGKAKIGPLLAMIVMLGTLFGAIALLTALGDTEGVLNSAYAISVGLIGLAIALGVAAAASAHIKLLPMIAAIMGLAAVVGAIIFLSDIDWPQLITAAGSLAIVAVSLGITAALLAKNALGAVAFDAMVVGILAIAAALTMMSDPAVLEGAKALGVVSILLGAAGALLAGGGFFALTGAVAFDLMSAGIIVIAGALSILANSNALEGAEALGLIVGVLTAASLVLGTFAPVALAGAGVLAVLGLALGVIAGVLYLAAAAFDLFVGSLERLQAVLISFGDISGEQVERIKTNMQGLGSAIGEGAWAAVQTFASNLWTAFTNIFANIFGGLIGIVKAGFTLVANSGLGNFILTVIGFFPKILETVKKIPEIAVEGLKTLKDKAKEAATNFKDGIVETLESNPIINGIKNAAAFIGDKVVEGFRSPDGIDAHSPSLKAIAAAWDFVKGACSGLKAGESAGAAAGASLGAKIGSAFRNSILRFKVSVGDLFAGIGGGGSGGSGGGDDPISRFTDMAKGLASSAGTALTGAYDSVKKNGFFKTVGNYIDQGRKWVSENVDTEAWLKEIGEKIFPDGNPLTQALDEAGEGLDNLGGGGGGSGGGGAAGAAKEVKKLFDVMKDGGKVVQKFAENFGVAYQNVANAHPLQVGQQAVQKLAEVIYAESIKGMDASELAAKTAEDKLADMREAFLNFYDGIKSSISGAVDEFGKFSEKAATFTNFNDWNNALDRQKIGIRSWEKELRLIAEKTKDMNFVRMLVEWGPEQIKDVRLLNSFTDSELKTLKTKMLEAGSSFGDAFADMIMADVAFTVSGLEKVEESVEDTSETVNDIVEETSNEVVETTEKSFGSFVTVTKDGVAVVSKAQATVIKGNDNVIESFKKTITITDQLKSKVTSIYSDVRDTVEQAISSNFNIFEKFDKETELTGDELLENMKSRLHGTREWQAGISELIGKGLNEGLAKKLMAEGTASYDKVKAMLEWSESEIDKANSYFEQSLTIAAEVADALGKDMATAGLAAAEGFASGFGSDATKAQMMQAARDAVNTIICEFNDPNSGTPKIGQMVMESTAESIEKNNDQVTNAAVKAMNETVVVSKATAIAGGDEVAYNLMNSTAESIKKYSYMVTNAMNEVTSGSIETAEDTYEIASPSKVFTRIGEYIDMGLANGLIDNVNIVKDATDSIGSSAIDSMKAVVGHIADIINGEVQIDPTIRPVMDLSEVEAGASTMNSMFGGRSYSMTRGINIQNANSSVSDLVAQMMAAQGAGATVNSGSPINMYVYAAPGQSEEEIANIVEQKIMFRINRTGGVWR